MCVSVIKFFDAEKLSVVVFTEWAMYYTSALAHKQTRDVWQHELPEEIFEIWDSTFNNHL